MCDFVLFLFHFEQEKVKVEDEKLIEIFIKEEKFLICIGLSSTNIIKCWKFDF